MIIRTGDTYIVVDSEEDVPVFYVVDNVANELTHLLEANNRHAKEARDNERMLNEANFVLENVVRRLEEALDVCDTSDTFDEEVRSIVRWAKGR